ncbi:MAG: endolytic transglycosylase MltG [Cellvibrionales bacterium]|nr:endolytic transglycosylase MltG [Cellvibrionales bacterium]
MRRAFKFLALGGILLTALTLLTATAAWVFHQRFMDAPLPLATPITIEVPPASTLWSVARKLKAKGALNHPCLLIWHAQWHGQSLIQAGEYRLEPGLTPRGLLRKLGSGAVLTYTRTFPEGIRFARMRADLEADLRLTADTKDLTDPQLIARLGLEVAHLEGWFYPDTYRFARHTQVSAILKRAHRQMRQTLQEEWQNRRPDLPLASPYEALILASLIEKETAVPAERATIAGVFIRRLQQGMRLQTDPTVIYALGTAYDGNLRRRDLNVDSPYNTYRYPGLPPTPIALPGRAAIAAALNPAAGDSLYFVARGDGSHHFSATLAEHNRAVRKYQIEKRRQDYRSTPAP